MRPGTSPGIPRNAPSISEGRYLLVSRIGEGGMAGVYRAWDQRLRVWRAVKVLFPQYAEKDRVRQRFATEAHTMARLEHPNLVRIYDVGDAGPLPFIVMELVEGGTIEQWVLRFGAMPPRLATQVMLEITDAAQATHAADVVHRDIKPQNILISAAGRCKLTDFGIAHHNDQGVTQTGMVMGTLGYMAPEQRQNAKNVDHRADIYALCSTLWTLLSGEVAHDLFNAPVDPSLLACIPEPLHPVILKGCTYARTERYADTDALDRALRIALSALPPDPEDTPPLNVDLDHEEPLTNAPKFPEIRAILDTGVTIDDTPNQPVSRQALPYFMPQTSPEEARDSNVPDYLRISDPPARRTHPAVTPEPSWVQPEPHPAESPSISSLPPTNDLPRAHRPQRPPPVAANPLTQFLTLASVPIGLTLAAATIGTVIGLCAFMYTGYQLYTAASVAIDSRAQVHEVLIQERAIIDQLARDVPRETLDQSYLAWLEAKGEPARIRAAVHFLDVVDQASSQRNSEPDRLSQDVDQVIRRLRASRGRYERDLSVWREQAESLGGVVLIAVGAGQAPPESTPPE